MTIFKQDRETGIQVSVEALALARLIWLRALLSDYTQIRLGWALLLLPCAVVFAYACSRAPVGIGDAGEGYSVSLRPPVVAIPSASQAQTAMVQDHKNVEQDKTTPEKAQTQPEPEVKPPLESPEPLVAQQTTPVPVQMTASIPVPCTDPTNSVENEKTVGPEAMANARGPGQSEIPETLATVTGMGQLADKPGSDSDGAKASYWMSVRNAVARNLSYPNRARSRGIEGRVVINLTLDGQGRVVNAEPVETNADSDLVKAAMKGIKVASPFNTPELVYGENMITAQLPIQFTLVARGTTQN